MLLGLLNVNLKTLIHLALEATTSCRIIIMPYLKSNLLAKHSASHYSKMNQIPQDPRLTFRMYHELVPHMNSAKAQLDY